MRRARTASQWLMGATIGATIGAMIGALGCDGAAKPPQGAPAQATATPADATPQPTTQPNARPVAQPNPQANAEAEAQTLPGVLVEAAWLSTQGAQQVIVVDVRSAQDYAAGHLPGAIWLNVSALDVAAAAQTKDVADEQTVRAALGAAGISAHEPVVLYGAAADYKVAARTFWILELHSHPAVAVLNGGYEGWVAASLPTQREPQTRPPTAYLGARKPALLADQARVMAASQSGGATLLDARSASDYAGQTAPQAMPRLGHIPGALNLDVSTTYQDQGGVRRLPMPDDLKALYEAALPPTGDVITYCNGGRSASLSYLELRAAGRQDVSIYDGSWGDWSSAGTTPVVTGPHPQPRPQGALPDRTPPPPKPPE
jgi:thiosulfate/3-mercaptopyruvate sulfurtransferase